MRIALGSSGGLILSRQQRIQLVHTCDIVSPESVFFFKTKQKMLECLRDLVHVRVSCFRCRQGQRKSCDGVEEEFETFFSDGECDVVACSCCLAMFVM